MLFRNGRWERGGYSNTAEVTKLLVEARLQYAAEHHISPKDFYMVSGAGACGFFVAHGYGSQAVLISSIKRSIDWRSGRICDTGGDPTQPTG